MSKSVFKSFQFWPCKSTLLMKSVFPFIHFIPSVWWFDGGRGQGGGVGLFMYVLMFNYGPRCLTPSLFFSSSLLQASQTELDSDRTHKSLVEPWSNQHRSWMAWESAWASSSLDNASSGYQTCFVPHNPRCRHLSSDWVSREWHDLSGELRGHQSAAQGHSDVHWLEPAMSPTCFFLLQVGGSINPWFDTFYHGKCQIEKIDDLWVSAMTVGDCLYSTRGGTQDLL